MYFKNLLSNFVETSLEYQYRDNYFFITGLIISLLMLIAQTWGLLAQNKKIVKNGSEAMSLIFFSGQFLYFFGYVNYGLFSHNLTIIISSLSGFIFLPIILNLIRKKVKLIKTANQAYEKTILSKRLKIELSFSALLFIILIPAIYIINDKNLLLLLLLAAVIASLFPQIYQVFKYRTVKNIAIKYVSALIISSLLYLIYGVMMEIYVRESWGIIATGSASLISLIVFYFLKMQKKSSY